MEYLQVFKCRSGHLFPKELPLYQLMSLTANNLVLLSEGVKNISNQLTITTEISAEHPELRSVAQAQGWWDGAGEFNFCEVFSPEKPPARMELAKQRYRGGTALLQQHDGECDPLTHFQVPFFLML